MIDNFEAKLAEYADLIVSVGANVQSGQILEISSPVECAYFAHVLAQKAYEKKCADVVPNWTDDKLLRMKYLYADSQVFDTYYPWQKLMLDELAQKRAAVISISATDPDALSGADPDRISRAAKAKGNAMKDYRQKIMTNYFPWCVVSVPTQKWAEKVFPDLKGTDAVDALWNAIFAAVRVDGKGGAVGAWKKHIAVMEKRAGVLNDLNFKSLHYTNSLGTNLVVELPKGHKWIAAGERAGTGVDFVANMPTEEIFTLPKKDGVNGVVYSSKPLIIDGSVIDNFCLEFKSGKIIKATAKKGEQVLKDAITLDENASYLGEVALVPHDSPISNSKLLFYNTLFDENASCHFAFGSAYPCFKDSTLTEQQMQALGKNESITHEDFMIGTPDLSIVGETFDGKKIAVFKNGNFYNL